MNRISAAIAASRYLRDRYARAGIHNEYDVDPQPDADGSTAWLINLSIALAHETKRPCGTYVGDLAGWCDRCDWAPQHHAWIEHPDRPRQWVRPALISDRDQTRVPPPGNQHGPGRNPIQGDAA